MLITEHNDRRRRDGKTREKVTCLPQEQEKIWCSTPTKTAREKERREKRDEKSSKEIADVCYGSSDADRQCSDVSICRRYK